MKFNPTDKSNSIIADIDFLLFGNGGVFNTKYSIVDRTRNINNSLDEVVGELFMADPNFMWDDTTNTDYPIAKLSLIAGRPSYTLPDSSLVIHRLRVKDRSGAYMTLTPKLRRELSDSELNSTGSPRYYYKIDNGIFLIPVPDYGAADGLELEFQRGANHFTTSSTDVSPGFNSQFHRFLSIDASLVYAMAHGMDKKMRYLSELKEQMRAKILKHYQLRSPDERPKIRLKSRNINSFGLR